MNRSEKAEEPTEIDRSTGIMILLGDSKKELEEEAAHNGLSPVSFARMLILKGIKASKEGNLKFKQ